MDQLAKLDLLDSEEREAYQEYLSKRKPPLAPSTSASFFQLFLQGHSTKEIARLNPAFGLGIIVQARIDNNWDKARDDHLNHLMLNIRQVTQQKQLGSIRFLVDAMSAFEKLAGEKFQRYVQTGDPSHLGEWKSMGIKQYKELVELILKLTGQDSNKKVSGDVVHRHVIEETPSITLSPHKPFSAQQADTMLQALDEEMQAKLDQKKKK
jgi:hypothetical protein